VEAREDARRFIYEYLTGRACADCGESDITVLTFDHVRGEKKMNIADMVSQGSSLKAISQELEKTDIVCFNCHMNVSGENAVMNVSKGQDDNKD